MKISLEIEPKPDEIEPLLRMVLLGQICEADVAKAKQREWNYQCAERNARASQLFVEANEPNKQKQLASETGK